MNWSADDHYELPDKIETGPRVTELLARFERQARREAGDDVDGEGYQIIHGLVRWNDDLDLDLETTSALIADSPELLLLLYDIDPEEGEQAVSLHAAADYAIKKWLTEQLEERLGLVDDRSSADSDEDSDRRDAD